jgi:dolichyl-phosphate beta-glucosyltransferase
LEGWAFDAELLFLAQKWGYKIAEVPVQWINDRGTKVGIFSSSAQMLLAILKVRLRFMVGGYRLKSAPEENRSAFGTR